MEKVELIQQIPLFHGVDGNDPRKLSEIATEEKIIGGRQVFYEVSKGNHTTRAWRGI